MTVRFSSLVLVIASALLYFFSQSSLANPDKSATPSNETAGHTPSHARAAVTAVLQMQADAWNRGDLDAFLTGYLHSPETSYVSSDSEVWGYDALRDRYQRKYGDKHDTMGTLKFFNLKVQDLGRRNALCIGHWHLDRTDKPPLEGIFSLTFVRTQDGWKIMHDHTSGSEHPHDGETKS